MEESFTRQHGNKSWSIVPAEQLTRFQLHEKGARVRVEASMAGAFGEVDPFSDNRPFIYDRPFFVFLWRDNAEWLCFGAWIGDASGLKSSPQVILQTSRPVPIHYQLTNH